MAKDGFLYPQARAMRSKNNCLFKKGSALMLARALIWKNFSGGQGPRKSQKYFKAHPLNFILKPRLSAPPPSIGVQINHQSGFILPGTIRPLGAITIYPFLRGHGPLNHLVCYVLGNPPAFKKTTPTKNPSKIIHSLTLKRQGGVKRLF